MIGILVFACVSDYRECSECMQIVKCTMYIVHGRKKNCFGSKQNRMAFVVYSVDAYMRANYFMFCCSRELVAQPRARVFSVEHKFRRRLRIEC